MKLQAGLKIGVPSLRTLLRHYTSRDQLAMPDTVHLHTGLKLADGWVKAIHKAYHGRPNRLDDIEVSGAHGDAWYAKLLGLLRIDNLALAVVRYYRHKTHALIRVPIVHEEKLAIIEAATITRRVLLLPGDRSNTFFVNTYVHPL